MILNSFAFALFFTFVFIFYWKSPPRYQWIILLLASYIFYGAWLPAYIYLIVCTTLLNYAMALMVYRQRKASTKKIIFIGAVSLNILLLGIFKYSNFFSSIINDIFSTLHWRAHIPAVSWVLPLGISFYTPQIIGYLYDIYKGVSKPEKHLGRFALFHSFFPQLSAGPIERGHTVLPQIKKQHIFSYTQAGDGSKLFTYGLFKKMVIADNLARIVDRVFLSLSDYKGLSLVIMVFLYSWQIYMDFSGYTDMARGIAKMLGIQLMENFNAPYLSTSVQEFWRRWHISFSSWLRDYVYIPLGGSRTSKIKTLRNTIIVFILSGLWHGAALHFVIWGLLHGVWICGERVSKDILGRKIQIPRFLSIGYTYCILCLFWIFFRTERIADAFYIIRNMFVGIKNIYKPEYVWASLNQLFLFNKVEMAIAFFIVSIAISLELAYIRISLPHWVHKQPLLIRYLFYALVLFLIIQFRNSDIQTFIYTKF